MSVTPRIHPLRNIHSGYTIQLLKDLLRPQRLPDRHPDGHPFFVVPHHLQQAEIESE